MSDLTEARVRELVREEIARREDRFTGTTPAENYELGRHDQRLAQADWRRIAEGLYEKLSRLRHLILSESQNKGSISGYHMSLYLEGVPVEPALAAYDEAVAREKP